MGLANEDWQTAGEYTDSAQRKPMITVIVSQPVASLSSLSTNLEMGSERLGLRYRLHTNVHATHLMTASQQYLLNISSRDWSPRSVD